MTVCAYVYVLSVL